MSLKIALILGTARESRSSRRVAEFIVSQAEKLPDLEVNLVDVRNFHAEKTHPGWKDDFDPAEEWKQQATKADAFVIVCPEYNHGYPGELKLLLDSAYQEYFYKPVLLAGVSSGGFGGSRVIEHIKPVLIELGMTPMGRSLYFSKVRDLFDEEGNIQDESYEDKTTQALNRLAVYAKHFAPLREALKDLDNNS